MDKELRQLQQLFPASEVLVQKCGTTASSPADVQEAMATTSTSRMSSSAPSSATTTSIADAPSTTPPSMVRCRASPPATPPTPCCCRRLSAFSPQTSAFTRASSSLATGLSIPRTRCATSSATSPKPRPSTWSVPFISFRVISDIPLRDTDASQYHNFWETIADHSFQVTKTFVESL